MTTNDALAAIRGELRRLANLIAELADRIEALERRNSEENHGKQEG